MERVRRVRKAPVYTRKQYDMGLSIELGYPDSVKISIKMSSICDALIRGASPRSAWRACKNTRSVCGETEAPNNGANCEVRKREISSSNDMLLAGGGGRVRRAGVESGAEFEKEDPWDGPESPGFDSSVRGSPSSATCLISSGRSITSDIPFSSVLGASFDSSTPSSGFSTGLASLANLFALI